MFIESHVSKNFQLVRPSFRGCGAQRSWRHAVFGQPSRICSVAHVIASVGRYRKSCFPMWPSVLQDCNLSCSSLGDYSLSCSQYCVAQEKRIKFLASSLKAFFKFMGQDIKTWKHKFELHTPEDAVWRIQVLAFAEKKNRRISVRARHVGTNDLVDMYGGYFISKSLWVLIFLVMLGYVEALQCVVWLFAPRFLSVFRTKWCRTHRATLKRELELF
jgi:hypothetical protein